MTINFENSGLGGVRTGAKLDAKGAAPGKSVKPDQPPAAPAPRDDVDLSQGVQALQKLAGEDNSVPDVNAERVEQIRQALADGNYPVDPVRVAQKFIELEGEL